MRKNYFAKLVRYMKNVYDIEDGLNKLTDGRINSTYDTAQVITLVLLVFLLRIKSFNELKLMIKNNEFSKLFSCGTQLSLADVIRDTLKALKIIGQEKTLYQRIRRTKCSKKVLKKECGLEHCFVHGDKAVEAVIYLIFIASNIMQLFLFRRLRKHFPTQREIVRLLLKGLYLMKYKSELVFNST